VDEDTSIVIRKNQQGSSAVDCIGCRGAIGEFHAQMRREVTLPGIEFIFHFTQDTEAVFVLPFIDLFKDLSENGATPE